MEIVLKKDGKCLAKKKGRLGFAGQRINYTGNGGIHKRAGKKFQVVLQFARAHNTLNIVQINIYI